MFSTKYGLIAFYLSYLFPLDASFQIVKHLKRLNGFELSKEFYITKCNLYKYIPYQYILNTSLHCRFSSCPPNVVYSSIYKNLNHRNLMKELNKTFSRNFENSSKILTYICNRQRIFDYDEHLYFWNYNSITQNINNFQNQFDNLIIVDNYNYHQYSDVLTYETKSSRKYKYFMKDNLYHYDLTYRFYDYPKKIKKKEFNSSIKKINYQKNQKRGFRRNY
jgi:hypothetical protein